MTLNWSHDKANYLFNFELLQKRISYTHNVSNYKYGAVYTSSTELLIVFAYNYNRIKSSFYISIVNYDYCARS